MKPTNKIKRHHYKSDCQIIERFYSYDDGTAVQVPVPERIKIEYYIDKGKGSIVVERKGDYCHNCSVSDDGMTLIAAIPLAKHPIGCGRLLCDKVEYIDDPLFPGGYKVKVTPMLTSIELWSQASDNDKSSAYGELLLAKIIRGKDGEGIPAGGSAGQVLSKKSDADYDTEWVDVPQGGGSSVDVVDNLTTADPTKVLSANMGKVLNEKFQYKNYLAGKNLDKKGNILDAKGWNVSTPIAVVGGTALTFECGGTNTSALCEYDANGNFLDYWGQSVHPRTFTTKANTAYVRLAVPNNPTQDYFVAQNDVVLFNKLRNFDIVEQVANLDEAAIEVTPLLSIENDIYPPHMRLIVEWSNKDAEVLQPVSYNAETNLFEVESMPSWLAEDGVIVPATINYSDTILWGTGGWQNVPFPKNNTQTVQHIKRVSATTFMALSHSAESSNQMDIIASPDCTLFSYCQAKDVQRLPLQLDGEELSGIKKFKIVIKDSNLHLAKTFCGVNSSSTMLLSNNYNRVLGAYLAETRPLMVSGYMIIEVDFDNAQYRYLEYQLSGLSRTGVQTVTPYVQMSKNTEQWSSIWPNTKPISQAFFLLPANALTKKCNVKIYEIYE